MNMNDIRRMSTDELEALLDANDSDSPMTDDEYESIINELAKRNP